MKMSLPMIPGTILLIVTAQAFAGDGVTVYGTARSNAGDPVRRATEACLQRFVEAIMPGGGAHVRAIAEPGDRAFRLESANDSIQVQMRATSGANGKPLASGSCIADLTAKVHQMSTQVLDAKQLAGLSARDIRVAVSSR